MRLEALAEIAAGGAPPPLDGDDRARLQAARAVVERVVRDGLPVYGVNTGFGSLSAVSIPAGRLAELQTNLVRSHAVGTGEPLPREVVRAMMALLATSLRRGHSGVRVELVALLLDMLDADVVPVVPSRGSVGASGDLAPLAHLALVIIGEGEAWAGAERVPGAAALAAAGLQPLTLAEKEGLALLNGTHLMAALGALTVLEAERLLEAAMVALALSTEAMKGSAGPLDARLHDIRGQVGQVAVATRLRTLLAASEIVASHDDCARVQDPYTLRCGPQVLGAIADALAYVRTMLERELTAVTDNPLVFAADDVIVAGGNFHGQPLSLPLDHLGLALCELASYSERRTFALLSPSEAGLPAYLSSDPGVESGLMIAQYVSAALVNECQVLAHPAGAGSIPTSAGMEDFNSMGAYAGIKARQIARHAARVIATELACATEGVEFHRPLRPTPALRGAIDTVRSHVAPLRADRSLAAELDGLAGGLLSGEVAFA